MKADGLALVSRSVTYIRDMSYIRDIGVHTHFDGSVTIIQITLFIIMVILVASDSGLGRLVHRYQSRYTMVNFDPSKVSQSLPPQSSSSTQLLARSVR